MFRRAIIVAVVTVSVVLLIVVILARRPAPPPPSTPTVTEEPPPAAGPRFRLPEKLAQELAAMVKDPAANLASQVDSLKASVGQSAATVETPLPVTGGAAGPVLDPAATFGEFCSTCHVLPTPEVEPREMWPAKIRQMYGYARGPRPVQPNKIPPIEAAIRYWSSRAPTRLVLPPGATGSPASPLAFTQRSIRLDAIPSPSAISCVKFVRLSDDAPIQLLISDMSHGVVVLWTPSSTAEPARILGRIPHPSRTSVVDLDGDGLRDILVANLGSFWPVDTTEGSVVWLRNRGAGQFESNVLRDGLGRVNDVAASDFDSDGDLDLVLGGFGNLTTGMILYLENVTEDYASPEFEPIPLDYHTGASDVLVLDLNQDERSDFVALQSQESELVQAFVNRGWGSFRSEMIYRAPHPRWGSTGILPVDLDRDGDIDLLYNHGDAVEFPPIPRPYHGVSWLENRGGFPFEYHRLTHLPGAHTSMPADLDGDGDIDVVSSVFIPLCDPNWSGTEGMDTVVWLEQTASGQFRRYSLERRMPIHPCGDVGDYDGDGDLDIILGNFFVLLFDKVSSDACLTVLENPLISAGSDSRRE